jgi:flagellar basal-body rod modification protein FlgD
MDAINALSSMGSSASPQANAYSQLNTEQFIKIIFTELSHQDPLAPNDSKALLEQLSNIRNIQSDMDLSTRLNSLVAQNEMSAAAGLIGKQISGVSEENRRIQGVVQSVIRTQEGAVLKLPNGQYVRMSNMDEVLPAPAAPTAPTPATPHLVPAAPTSAVAA